MQPLAVDLRLLPEAGSAGLRLTPGRALMARVMEADGHGHGRLNIAGAVIEAELPQHLRAGEQLRLVVRELDARRVVLEQAPAQARPEAPAQARLEAPAAPPAVPLPGGGTLRIADEPAPDGAGSRHGAGADTQTLALHYDAPALGRLDLRFELAAASLQVTVAAPAGPALELARDGAGALREALLERSERPVAVTVQRRHEPLDVYA